VDICIICIKDAAFAFENSPNVRLPTSQNSPSLYYICYCYFCYYD